MRRLSRRALLRMTLWLIAVVIGAVIATAYAVAIDGRPSVGALNGFVIGGGIAALEIYILEGRWGRTLRQLGIPRLMLATTVVWTLLIVGTLEASRAIFGHPWGAGPLDHPHSNVVQDLALAFSVGFLISLLARLQGLIGLPVFINYLIGRYAQPVREDKVVMILDLVDSTALAEKLGDIQVQRLIGRFFSDIADPIIEHDGDIHQYIGDAVVVTWPKERGIADAHCLRCVIEIRKMLAREGERYRSRFGAVPSFRAGMHCGPVVVSEVGDIRRAVAYFGDTMNTSGRLQQRCKDLEEQVLVSEALVSSIELPSDISLTPLGDITLPGKQAPIAVYSL